MGRVVTLHISHISSHEGQARSEDTEEGGLVSIGSLPPPLRYLVLSSQQGTRNGKRLGTSERQLNGPLTRCSAYSDT